MDKKESHQVTSVSEHMCHAFYILLWITKHVSHNARKLSGHGCLTARSLVFTTVCNEVLKQLLLGRCHNKVNECDVMSMIKVDPINYCLMYVYNVDTFGSFPNTGLNKEIKISNCEFYFQQCKRVHFINKTYDKHIPAFGNQNLLFHLKVSIIFQPVQYLFGSFIFGSASLFLILFNLSVISSEFHKSLLNFLFSLRKGMNLNML